MTRGPWPIVLLEDLRVEARPGFASGRHSRDARGVLHLRPMNITSHGSLSLGDAKFVADESDRRVHEGDVLFNNTNSAKLIGKTAYVGRCGHMLAYSNHMTRLRVTSPLLDPKFLAWSLQWKFERREFEALASNHVNQASIGTRLLLKQGIALPPLAEQRRIVEILEEHLSHLDAANLDVARARVRLESLVESALRHQIGDGHIRRPLSELLELPLANGRSVPSQDGGFPVLRLTALKESGVDLTERKCGAWQRPEAVRFLVKRGDFLIARGNGSKRLVGRGALVNREPDEVAFPDTVIRARPRLTDLLPEFLELVWNARVTREQIEHVARTSAGIYKVNQVQLGAVQLPVPDLWDQQRVVAALDRLREDRQAVRDALERAEQRSLGLRRAVLAAAFEGRLTGRQTDGEAMEEALTNGDP